MRLMTAWSVTICCVLLFAGSALGAAGAAFPALRAFEPTDNDLHPDNLETGPSKPVPAAVQAVLQRKTEEAYRAYAGDEPDPDTEVSLASFVGATVKIRARDGLELFVYHLSHGPTRGESYLLVLYDPRAKRVTEHPIDLWSKWMEGDWGAELKKPIVSFDDLDGDGFDELVFEQRVHNGTLYNAAIYHWFRIAPDLSLNRMLAIETRAIVPESGVIERTVRRAEGGRLILTAEFREEKTRFELGHVELVRDSPDRPYRTAKRTVLQPEYDGVLVTNSSVDENELLAKGYSFRY